MKFRSKKGFWLFYAITALVLAAAAAIPVRHFIAMVLTYYSITWISYDVTLVVPFAAVLVAILIGFLLLPIIKNRLIVCIGAVGIFGGLAWYAEMIIARRDATFMLMLSRMWRSPEEITAIVSGASIPWAVRAHYYIFSIVLVVAVVNFLYSLANTLLGDGKPGRPVIILQGIAVACYACAYFFVSVMQFQNLATLQLTWWSVFNVAACFILAAIAVGLCNGFNKITAALLSTITVLALYAAEYFLLDGNFYSYHENAIITMGSRLLIIIIPGMVVYYVKRIR